MTDELIPEGDDEWALLLCTGGRFLRYTREGSGMYGFGMLFMDFELMIDLICCFPPPMETK